MANEALRQYLSMIMMGRQNNLLAPMPKPAQRPDEYTVVKPGGIYSQDSVTIGGRRIPIQDIKTGRYKPKNEQEKQRLKELGISFVPEEQRTWPPSQPEQTPMPRPSRDGRTPLTSWPLKQTPTTSSGRGRLPITSWPQSFPAQRAMPSTGVGLSGGGGRTSFLGSLMGGNQAARTRTGSLDNLMNYNVGKQYGIPSFGRGMGI